MPDISDIPSYAQGLSLIFENAESLYEEGCLLGENGRFARAFLCHQISMEELAKVDFLGTYVTGLLIGHDAGLENQKRNFRDHKKKNKMNAFLLPPSPEMSKAYDKGDWRAALSAFEQMQGDFHKESNDGKNSSLYVDWTETGFVSPKQAITEGIAEEHRRLNSFFLNAQAPKLTLFQRWSTADSSKLGDTVTWFIDTFNKLRLEHPDSPDKAMMTAMSELAARVKADPEAF